MGVLFRYNFSNHAINIKDDNMMGMEKTYPII